MIDLGMAGHCKCCGRGTGFCSKIHQNYLINLAGHSAKFDSSGILAIAWILLDSSRNQWRTIKTSNIGGKNENGGQNCFEGAR